MLIYSTLISCINVPNFSNNHLRALVLKNLISLGLERKVRSDLLQIFKQRFGVYERKQLTPAIVVFRKSRFPDRWPIRHWTEPNTELFNFKMYTMYRNKLLFIAVRLTGDVHVDPQALLQSTKRTPVPSRFVHHALASARYWVRK